MTTARFSSLASATARTIASVKTEHCKPPLYRPAERVTGHTRCMKCGGLVYFEISAVNGASRGHCSSINCVRWME